MSKKNLLLPFTTLALLLGVGLAACSGTPQEGSQGPSNEGSQPAQSSQAQQRIKITAADGKTTIYLGQKVQLSADVDGVSWESAKPEIASVDANGLVTAVAQGTAAISAKKDGFTAGTININVQLEPIKVTAADNKTTLIIDETVQLSADKDGVSWKSSNEDVATVSSSGLVTALKAGSASITASKEKYKDGSISITVTRPAATGVVSWDIADHYSADGEWTNSNRGPGETPLYQKSSASDGQCVGYFGDGDKETLTFKSDKAVKAELVVSMGHNSSYEPLNTIMTAKFNNVEIDLSKVSFVSDSDGQGNYTFQDVSFGEFDLLANDNVLEISMLGNAPYLDDLKVYAASAATITGVPAPEKEAIVILNEESELTIEAESTVQLRSATEGLTYASSSESVATVNDSGLVTGVAKGTATITVRKDGMKTTKVTIKVTEKIVAGEIRVEAETGTCNDAVIGSDTPIVTRSTSTGETCTAQWAAGVVLVIKANATKIGSFNLYLNGRAGGQYGTANIDDLAACIEVKFNGAALTLSGGISGRTFTDYLLGAVTTKIGENIIEIKSIGDEDTAPNIDFIKLVPVE